MVYNTQIYWVLEPERQRFGNWICFRPQVKGKTPAQLGPLERANLNHWIN
jgi:hypothetical protein